jgi:hypothetical protein
MKLLIALVTAAMLPLSPALLSSPAQAPRADCATTSSPDDFDGDGASDVAVGDPFAKMRGLPGAGAVQVVHEGRATVLGASDPKAGDGFGWTVVLGEVDGDACADLLVGAPYTDVAGRTDAGAVYILYGGTSRSDRIVAPEPQRDAHFGWSLAHSADGTASAIGAPHEDDDGVRDAGAIYLFRDGKPGRLTRISQEDEGVPGNSEVGDMFGWSLALGRMAGDADELDLAAGSPYENNDGAGRQNKEGMLDTGGLTVVYDPLTAGGEYDGEKLEMRDQVGDAAREAPGDRFGYALSYMKPNPGSGNQSSPGASPGGRLAVSAPMADAGGVRDSGLVHVLRSPDGTKLIKGDTIFQGGASIEGEPGVGEGFGFAVALGDDSGDIQLAVGVPFDGEDGRGAVQVVPLRTPAQDRLITAGTAQAGDHFGWSVGFSGNRVVAGAPDAAGGGTVGVAGGEEAAFTLLDPAPAPGGDEPADFGVSVSG